MNYTEFNKDFLVVLQEFQKDYPKSYSLVDFIEFLNNKQQPILKDESDFFNLDNETSPEQYDFAYKQKWAEEFPGF